MCVAALLALAPVGVEAQGRVGAFRLSEVTDPMSDRDLSYISTSALADQEGELVWQCAGNTMELVLRVPSLSTLSGPVPVRWRFDRSPASDRQDWRASTLEPHAYAPEETIYPFTEVATASGTVLVRVEDREGRSYDYRFNLSGLNNGLNRLDCTRHLEVLGQRRTQALLEQAELDATGGGEDGLERLISVYPFVGHRTQRRYAASSNPCWRNLWPVDEIVFFRNEREARAEGFASGSGCGL